LSNKETNLRFVKLQTSSIAHMMVPKDVGWGFTNHPFVEHTIWHDRLLKELPRDNGGEHKVTEEEQKKYNLCDRAVYDEWLKEFDKMVMECPDLTRVYMFWRAPYKLTFMKYCGEYLSDKDYAEYLADAWVTEENPNMDANVTRKEALAMFRSCKKHHLMTKEDLEVWKNIPETITLYRGVCKGHIALGLSWTDDREKAEWFRNRFNTDGVEGKLLSVKANRKDIIAYFNTRSEKEMLLDVFQYVDDIVEI